MQLWFRGAAGCCLAAGAGSGARPYHGGAGAQSEFCRDNLLAEARGSLGWGKLMGPALAASS